MPRPARRLFSALALALTIGASAGLAAPAAALASTPDVPVAVSPQDGAFVEPGAVVLEWTAVEAPQGYEVSWADDAGGDGGTVSTADPSLAIAIEGGSYAWQVRVLPDGEWSTPATFYADLELTTLPMPEEPAAATPARPGVDAVPGSVWILGALGFAVVFLAVVVVQSRLHREQDA